MGDITNIQEHRDMQAAMGMIHFYGGILEVSLYHQCKRAFILRIWIFALKKGADVSEIKQFSEAIQQLEPRKTDTNDRPDCLDRSDEQ